MKNIAALGLAGLLVTVTTVASADDSKLGGAGESCESRSDCQAAFSCIQKTCSAQTASTRVVASDASLNAGFAPAHEQPRTRMKSPGQVVGGIVVTVLGLGAVVGGVGMIGWWVSNKADSVVDEHTSSSFYSGAVPMIIFGAVGAVAGIVLVSQGARRVELKPGLGSLSLSGTF